MKTCPICQARAFNDALTCYGCMHRFDITPHETLPCEKQAASLTAENPLPREKQATSLTTGKLVSASSLINLPTPEPWQPAKSTVPSCSSPEEEKGVSLAPSPRTFASVAQKKKDTADEAACSQTLEHRVGGWTLRFELPLQEAADGANQDSQKKLHLPSDAKPASLVVSLIPDSRAHKTHDYRGHQAAKGGNDFIQTPAIDCA